MVFSTMATVGRFSQSCRAGLAQISKKFTPSASVNRLSARGHSSVVFRLSTSYPRAFATRGASTSRSNSTLSTLLNSHVSFRLVNGLYAGVIFTVVWYGLRKRGERRRRSKKEVTPTEEMYHFKDKTVVITGGAGDIGINTASAFAHKGATVVLVDLPHTESDLSAKCKELVKTGAPSAEYVTCDVTKEEDVKSMVKSITDKVGRIDIFFNNAGVQGTLRPLHQQDDKEFRKVVDVNIYGVFLGMKYVSKAMIESGKGGVIVNTASLAGLLGPANMAAYAASKFAVVGMTKTAAKDLAMHGIRVCAIAPGILEGKMWGTQIRGNALCRKRIQGDLTEVTEEEVKAQETRMIEGTPMKRLGKLSEVAAVVLFLSSDEASYLTGLTVPIDGGRIP